MHQSPRSKMLLLLNGIPHRQVTRTSQPCARVRQLVTPRVLVPDILKRTHVDAYSGAHLVSSAIVGLRCMASLIYYIAIRGRISKAIFSKTCSNLWDAKKNTITSYHPSGNGRVPRNNGVSSHYLLCGRPLRLPLNLSRAGSLNDLHHHDLQRRIKLAERVARKTLDKRRPTVANHYNKKPTRASCDSFMDQSTHRAEVTSLPPMFNRYFCPCERPAETFRAAIAMREPSPSSQISKKERADTFQSGGEQDGLYDDIRENFTMNPSPVEVDCQMPRPQRSQRVGKLARFYPDVE
ncbi:unnamed protein product [Clavelina lepadiformis]|uniref:Uncharacterized protein n=1 Tax=Clavelina lepadiformis TaxID=159417 RepID=A0ABP0FJU9_CLALP